MGEVVFGSKGYSPITFFDLPSVFASPKVKPLLSAAGAMAPVPAAKADPTQFMLFRIGDEKSPLFDLTSVHPTVAGSDEKPDIDASINLLAFHFDETMRGAIDDKSRATLRFDLGKDDASTSPLEPLVWSIASGLDLYEHFKGSNRTEPNKMNENFANTFKRRPIEIPGGLGQLKFEVIMHKEPPWWRRILRFGGTDTARRLVTSLGFPGIAIDAMRLVDEMLSRFDDTLAKPLITTRPLTLAFSKYARDEYTGGDSSALIGAVGNGTYVITRFSDLKVFTSSPPLFLGSTGQLVPRKEWTQQGLNFDYAANPYNEATYAVLKIRTYERRIQVT